MAVAVLASATLLATAWTAQAGGGSNPAAPAQPVAASPQDAEREAQLVATEDGRLNTLLSTMNHKSGKHAPTGPQLLAQGLSLTLVLPPRAAAYTLADLTAAAPNLIQTRPDGSLLFTGGVLVAPGAHLVIAGSRPLTLLLASDQDGFISIVSWGGRLDFDGTSKAPITVASWDRRRGGYVTSQALGRAYVREAGGTMNVSYVHALDLGFWSGRTGGFAWTGTDRNPGSGVVTNSTFTGGEYGIFASRTSNLQVYRCRFDANSLDGYDQHRLSAGNVTRDSIASRNGWDGFAVDRGSSLATFEHDIASSNGHDGFYLDGQPLSRGGSASGGSTTAYGNDVVDQSWAAGNGAAGILVSGGLQQSVRDTQADGNQDGVDVRNAAVGFTVTGDEMRANRRFGVFVDSGASGTVSGDVVDGATTGILVRSAGAQLTHDTVADVTMHGISLQGDLTATAVEHDLVSGHGLTAIDTKRVVDLHVLSLLANNLTAWVQLHRIYPWYHVFEQHPLLVLWSFILLVPLVFGGLLRRQRRGHPYAQTTRWPQQAGVELSGTAASRAHQPSPAADRVADHIDITGPVRVTYASPR
jgi:hypothetical protein